MQFADLRLAEPILRALTLENYVTATPIQAQAIPHILAGKDVLGSAQTGTGKTAAFALPMLQRLSEAAPAASPNGPRRIRALILCPTRELAVQIGLSLKTYGRFIHLRYAVIFGGVGQGPQTQALETGVDVVVATPGRLMDLMNQGYVDLGGIEFFVLDEADRMLDMGFMPDIRRIAGKLPAVRQSLLFSATMPRPIEDLARTLLKQPVKIEVAGNTTPGERIEQWVYHTDRGRKPALLAHLVKDLPMFRTIVFSRTKHGADRIVRQLRTHGIASEAIHGNKAQNARKRALETFRSGKVPVLVATDIASRGIDIDDVSHVVNYDITHEPETYVHRIGRTARAGATGVAISLCDPEERNNLRAIEHLMKQKLVVKTTGDVQLPTASAEAAHDNDYDDDRRDGRRNGRQGGRAPAHSNRSAAPAHPRRHSSDRFEQRAERQPQAATAAHAPRSEPAATPAASKPALSKPTVAKPATARPAHAKPMHPKAAPGGKPGFGTVFGRRKPDGFGGRPGGTAGPARFSKPRRDGAPAPVRAHGGDSTPGAPSGTAYATRRPKFGGKPAAGGRAKPRRFNSDR